MYRAIHHHLHTIFNKELDSSGEEAETAPMVAEKLATSYSFSIIVLVYQNTQVVQGDTQRLRVELGNQVSSLVPRGTNSRVYCLAA